jgi:hypothetical protein
MADLGVPPKWPTLYIAGMLAILLLLRMGLSAGIWPLLLTFIALQLPLMVLPSRIKPRPGEAPGNQEVGDGGADDAGA